MSDRSGCQLRVRGSEGIAGEQFRLAVPGSCRKCQRGVPPRLTNILSRPGLLTAGGVVLLFVAAWEDGRPRVGSSVGQPSRGTQDPRGMQRLPFSRPRLPETPLGIWVRAARGASVGGEVAGAEEPAVC